MAEPIVSFILENDRKIQEKFTELATKVSDLRIPFGLIANNFYQGNKKIFTLKGPGRYEDLADSTKKQKQSEVGFIYPILKRTGRLSRSLTSKNDSGAEFFVGRKSMILGTKVPYLIYHQSDKPRKKIPQRKALFIDGGGEEVARDAIISGRLQAWTNIVDDYIAQVLSGSASV